MRTRRIFWSDETWVDRDTCRRFNPQNDRVYFPKGVKKDDMLGDLRAPPRQRAPGIMGRISVSPAQHGVLLNPHHAGPEKTATAEYYNSMLKTDVFSQIAALLQEGEKFWFQPDLTCPPTAELTGAFLDEQGICLAPWLPSGADVS